MTDHMRDDGAPQHDDAAAREPEIAALLERLQSLRLTLTADLSAAASALDADQPEIARDIIAADSMEVRRLSTRPAAAARGRSRSRRALVALPAIPLVGALAITGAAALNGHSAPHDAHRAAHHHAAAADPATPADIRRTPASTLLHLERVVTGRPQPARIMAVADRLHHQLTAIIATSPHSAHQLREVSQLLAAEQHLLETHHGHATAIALAASRQLNRLLAAAGLPTSVPDPAPSDSVPPVATSPHQPGTPKPAPPTITPRPTPTSTFVITTVPTPTPSSSAGTHDHHHKHGRHHHDAGITDPVLGGTLLDDHS